MSGVSREIARLYDAGNGEALLEHLEKFPLEHYVPIATSLGLYNEAVSVMVPLLREFSTDGFMQALLLVNTAEPLSELGRYDEALALLETPCPFELIEAGRRCTRSWILSTLDQHDEARKLLSGIGPQSLHVYRCEYWLTLARIEMRAGSLDACEDALLTATKVAQRASSRRNVEFHWAELHRARGDFTRALKHYGAGATHLWRWQGGSGLLNWGTLLAQLGRHHEARAAWTQCLEQDPQSLAAIEAKQRLAP